MTPSTRRQLDTWHCGHDEHEGHQHDDECSVLFLHSRCHPTADTTASYDKRTGVLSIACATCERPIIDIEVAP